MGAHRFAALVLEWSCWLPLVNLVLCTIATADLSKRELSERFSFSNIVEGLIMTSKNVVLVHGGFVDASNVNLPPNIASAGPAGTCVLLAQVGGGGPVYPG